MRASSDRAPAMRRRTLIGIGGALVIGARTAAAQAQPAPRMTLDVALPPATGFAFNHAAPGARLEASADIRRVVRADALGAIRWHSATADVTDIAPTPDGQLAALARSGKDGETLRLVRYADP
ncbi:hypothetical protein FHP25_00280 [Vineibacter terrae]|uniref:Uncharacterized protein n=1 Tax=Vineibacter terrae TaxID=2586908 RepID=A0A5C8PVN5_9HYPH|nr:hypothetical protein [Vineibacter terrae]TXL82174.1 hypothetical protein FHP25_00280 [Vineibacter terrae]